MSSYVASPISVISPHVIPTLHLSFSLSIRLEVSCTVRIEGAMEYIVYRNSRKTTYGTLNCNSSTHSSVHVRITTVFKRLTSASLAGNSKTNSSCIWSLLE
jgi:hypothetical protein